MTEFSNKTDQGHADTIAWVRADELSLRMRPVIPS
ncbi:MAG: hypothetical protein RL584_1270 [Pseudomonadota bacterium]